MLRRNIITSDNESSINVSNIINKNIVDFYLSKILPNKKAKIKIPDDEFFIPNYAEYSIILDNVYNIKQYKTILKHYKLKINGNKDELKKRIYNYLYYMNNAIIIQKYFRRFFIKNYIELHGPGFLKRNLCVNDSDFYNLDDVASIIYPQFFSFIDNDNFIYGFDIRSLYNLYIKNSKSLDNPYTKKKIDKAVFNNMIKLINYSNILNIPINLNLENSIHKDENKKFEMKIIDLFQEMDSLGNYTNVQWILSLNKFELIKFIKELIDIWNYRAMLSQESKKNICYPYGNPFKNINVKMIYNNTIVNNINLLKKMVLIILDEFINTGITNENRCLGSYYVLSALTLVNNEAAQELPWLYQAVEYD